MCGICGIFDLDGAGQFHPESIKKMISALHHRGPDESGIYMDDDVLLGHSRLSIIDLSGGTQPIHNEDKSLWIVYNGEIFNYPELRQDLIKKGHHFYTSTDTEVIIHLYENIGPACLNKLNGQFAFVIWDVSKKEMFLARDRVGIRPLFYTFQNNTFYFASEIKSIFMNPEIQREIDPAALHQIFTFWTTLPEKTVFKQIYELPPGHFMFVSPERQVIRKYWELPFYPPENHLDWSSEKIIEHIQELLLDATRIRLRSDVPVGCYVSGGLDSSAVAALVAKNFNNDVRTFGIRFEEKEFDEGEYQTKMVSYLNTRHVELQATNNSIASAFYNVIWHCEKPILRTAPVR